MDAERAAELAARASYGRLVALLAARFRDVAAAEDALGEAFRAALETWPRDGVPDRPEAWLMAAARRRLLDGVRHARVRDEAGATLSLLAEEAALEDDGYPDERLKLLFVCAHPAIDAGLRTPLMLQTVLGLDAARIASAFVMAPATMGQRLVRAKAKIRDAGIPFVVPERREWSERLPHVLEAIYAAYGTGWEDPAGIDERARGLTAEAIFLARLLVDLAPSDPEARGLLALMLFCESRRAARRDADGRYVPLTEQDAAAWDVSLLAEAERHLFDASRHGRPGRLQLEAAIQSVHAARARTERTDWDMISLFYEGLVRMSPTLGAAIGRASALLEARGAEAALAALDQLPPESVASYQPYWAVRAHALSRSGRTAEAREAFKSASGLSRDPSVRAFLAGKIAPG